MAEVEPSTILHKEKEINLALLTKQEEIVKLKKTNLQLELKYSEQGRRIKELEEIKALGFLLKRKDLRSLRRIFLETITSEELPTRKNRGVCHLPRDVIACQGRPGWEKKIVSWWQEVIKTKPREDVLKGLDAQELKRRLLTFLLEDKESRFFVDEKPEDGNKPQQLNKNVCDHMFPETKEEEIANCIEKNRPKGKPSAPTVEVEVTLPLGEVLAPVRASVCDASTISSLTTTCPQTKRKRVSKVYHEDLDPVEGFNEIDVLMGRGGFSNNHMGNKRFRCMVDELKDSYKVATNKEKTRMSMMLVDMIKEVGGRFLRYNPETERWHEVMRTTARLKAAQALRTPRATHPLRVSEHD